MNTRILLVIALTTVPLLSATAQWQQPQPRIDVSGSAELKVTPDEVDLKVSVETRNESLDEAKQENDKRISQALDFLKKSRVKDKDVQTDYISVEPVFETIL